MSRSWARGAWCASTSRPGKRRRSRSGRALGLEIDPSGRRIYATLNAENRVARLNLHTGRVKKVSTGTLPRSLAIADDAKAIYVVNYESGTVSKLRTPDLEVLQTVDACYHPIGITYDAPTRRVWVACYGGSILVFNDRR
jgi:DNA-binding beta-propeller fold protein YncE